MGQRAEGEIDVAEWGVLGRDEGDVAAGNAYGRTALGVRRGEGERQVRVPQDECAELATSVAAGPEDADWNIIHTECIIMHSLEVNPALLGTPGRVPSPMPFVCPR